MKKTCVIYHNCDLDGQMSAAIVKHWFMSDKSNFKIRERKEDGFLDVDSIEFIGYNYGQPIPDLSEYDKVIMCDISFPKEEMKKLLDRLDYNFVWIDHHISAIKDNFEEDDDYEYTKFIGLRNTNFAACELTWKFLFPDEPMPEIVRLLGLYDSFRHKGTDEETKVLEFQYGARQKISNVDEAYAWLTMTIDHPEINDEIGDAGSEIFAFLCTDAKQSYKNGFESPFYIIGQKDGLDAYETYKFICINKERFNPINFGIDYCADGYDGAACFHIDSNGMFCFSLYNDNGLVDCSLIAKQYGGGGHKGAAGFRLTLEQFKQFRNE